MAKYTTQLKSIVESGIDVFDTVDYPIFDASYRSVLNQKIIDNYYFREIGFETFELFRMHLRVKMNNIMPYYNQLYESETILNNPDFNPLNNLNTTETSTRTLDSASSGSDTNSGKNTFSDTPQAKLQGLDYATNLTEGESTSEATGEIKTTEEYVNKVVGSGGLRYPADIVMEWRKSFLNIDLLIVEELNDLFMNIY